jgi:predicted nucleotidyltransferase
MEPNGSLLPGESQADGPSSEELRAELLEIPEPPEPSKPIEHPGTEQILASALRYVRGKRGGDLLTVILVGSGARRALTPHSDLDLIALVKGQDEGQEIIRISDRLIEIRYRGHKSVEQELQHVLRLPPLLRKGRILFEHEAAGAKLMDKANQRFRQGPPPVSLNEKIRLKAECLHWLGKAEDLAHQPATAGYLLGLFSDDLIEAFFRLRGFWPTAPADTLRFVSSRDSAVGGLLDRFLTGQPIAERIATARELADQVFRDVPNPPRVD